MRISSQSIGTGLRCTRSAIGVAINLGLARDLSGAFGSALYAKEELVAEITSAFVCASLGIVPTVRHADYLGSWLEVLREDDRAIVRAASAASKAADYLLAFRPKFNDPIEAIEASDDLLAGHSQAICA